MSICRHGPIWIIFSHLRIFRADRHKEEPRQIVCVSRCSDVPTEKLFFLPLTSISFLSVHGQACTLGAASLVNQRRRIDHWLHYQSICVIHLSDKDGKLRTSNLFWRLSLVRVCMLWSSNIRISPSVMLLWGSRNICIWCKPTSLCNFVNLIRTVWCWSKGTFGEVTGDLQKCD
jgi:hypothetical protein